MQRISNSFGVSRRTLIKAAGASAALAAAGLPVRLFAADPIKVAAIYTVPVEQQWVSRIHKARQRRQGARRHRICLFREHRQHRL